MGVRYAEMNWITQRYYNRQAIEDLYKAYDEDPQRCLVVEDGRIAMYAFEVEV